MPEHPDHLHKFLLQDRGARVIAVELQDVWREARVNQPNPPALTKLLGELVAAATLLTANLKFDGSLLLQLQGNGAVKLIVVECRQDLSIRATVKLSQTPSPDAEGLQALLNADGQGRFSVILNPPSDNPGRQPYHGIVPLESDSVSGVLENYMRQSEQLETRIWLVASNDRAVGLFVQRMPNNGGTQQTSGTAMQESWSHALALCDTVTNDELMRTPVAELLHRLFWQTPIIQLETLPVSWRCSCTHERVSNMLRSLGELEVQEIITEQGQVEVICDFCGKPYRFDKVDAASLFKSLGHIERQQIH